MSHLYSLRAAPIIMLERFVLSLNRRKVIFVDDFIRRRSTLAIRRQDTPELQKELAAIMPELNSLAEQANLKTALIAVARFMSIRVSRYGSNLVVKRP